MDNEYKRAANITVIVIGAIVFLWLIFKYALGALMPFILAAIVAEIIFPLSEKIHRKSKIPHKLISAIILIILFSVIISFLYYAAARLLSELGNLMERLSEDPEIISRALESTVNKLNGFVSRFGFIRKIFASDTFKDLGLDLDRMLTEALNSLMSSLTSQIPTAAMGFVAKIPSALLFTAVFLIATFYFCADRKKLGDSFSNIMPDRWQRKLPSLKKKISSTLAGYVKAYLLIMLLTFAQVFIGLSILRVNYALLMSLIIAVVDILPILGTGTVLVPWAIYAYSSSDARLGTGLLILYGIVLIVRQIIEPKIVGGSIGLHPLVTLASIYLGIKFAGFWGIFLGPIIALFLKSMLKGEEELQTEMSRETKGND